VCGLTPDVRARSLLHNRLRKEDDMGTHIIGKPFPVPANLTYAQLYTIVWDRYRSSRHASYESALG
jgi:hypothetical protein